LLDEALLLEASEKAADGLARSTNHLADLFVGQSHLYLAGVSGFDVLVEPSHKQASYSFSLAESESIRSRISRQVPA
jgi:hypothetical protein